MSEKHFIGDYVTSFDDVKKRKPVSRVTLMYDDENGFTAGDDTGLEVVASCYFATQAMADNALAALQGYQYHPFSAGSANLDPAAELGDGVTVGGIYSVIAGLSDNGYGFPDVEAPGEEELEEEFPHPGFLTQEVKRKVALGRSYYGTRITRANGLEVVKTEADGTEKSRVKLNSDILAFYDDDGEEALYFDAAAGRYRFRGDVEVTGGSMNINNNFIIDPDGNATVNGDLNLSKGKITWGDNLPPSGISAATAEQIASTVVSEELVAAPTIMGAKVYGGAYYDSYGGGRLTLAYENFPLLHFEGEVDGEYRTGFAVAIIPDGGDVAISFGNGDAWTSNVDSYWTDGVGWYTDVTAQGRHTFAHEAIFDCGWGVTFNCQVDFSNATVTGLDIVFG